jgi:hypothetical protein
LNFQPRLNQSHATPGNGPSGPTSIVAIRQRVRIMATEGTRFCDWLTRQPELLHRKLDLERDERDAFGVAKASQFRR